MDVLLEFIKTVLELENLADKLKELVGLMGDVFQLMLSGKHRVGRDLGRLRLLASLRYRVSWVILKGSVYKKFKKLTIEL